LPHGKKLYGENSPIIFVDKNSTNPNRRIEIVAIRKTINKTLRIFPLACLPFLLEETNNSLE